MTPWRSILRRVLALLALVAGWALTRLGGNLRATFAQIDSELVMLALAMLATVIAAALAIWARSHVRRRPDQRSP